MRTVSGKLSASVVIVLIIVLGAMPALAQRYQSVAKSVPQKRPSDAVPPTAINEDGTGTLPLKTEVLVAAERVRLTRSEFQSLRAEQSIRRSAQTPDQTELINPATNLARELLELLALKESLGNETADQQTVRKLYNKLSAEEAMLVVQEGRENLRAERPSAPNELLRRRDLIRALLTLGNRRLIAEGKRASDDAQLNKLAKDFETIRQRLDNIDQNLDRLPQLDRSSALLLDRADALIRAEAGRQQKLSPRELIDELLKKTEELLPVRAAGIKGLLIQRLAILRQYRETLRLELRIGLAGSDDVDVLRASADILRAELELCETPAERIACHKQCVKYMKDLENLLNEMGQHGHVLQHDLMRAKLMRLEAEIGLHRELEKNRMPVECRRKAPRWTNGRRNRSIRWRPGS